MSSGAPAARTDVAIVGAGPTGLALACALAARGIEFVVLDRSATGQHTSRAAVVHARTLEMLEDIDVTRDLQDRGVVVPYFTIKDRDRTLLSVPFDRLPTRYPYTLMCPQNITERVLEDRLVALGATVHREHAVTGVEIDGDRATVLVTQPDGTPVQVDARYVVGCDGMHSTVREHAGIEFVGDRYLQSFLLADVHMDWHLSRQVVHLFFSPKGLVVVAPLPEDRLRVVTTMDTPPEQPTPADVQALLDARGPVRSPAKVRDVVWGSRFRVQHRLASSYRRGPVFLAGDAAHVHSPAGGQGMNTGIHDAITLAATLADVLAGRADAAHLHTYEATRRPVAVGVVTATDRLTRAATARGPLARAAHNAAISLAGHLPPVQQRIAMTLSQLSTRPDPPPLGTEFAARRPA